MDVMEKVKNIKAFLSREGVHKKLMGLGSFVSKAKPKPLTINMGGGSYTDGKKIVVGVPEETVDKPMEIVYLMTQTLFLHELQHTLSSNFIEFTRYINEETNKLRMEGVSGRFAQKIVHAIGNSVEDGRIEHIAGNNMPGSIPKFQYLNMFYWNRNEIDAETSELTALMSTLLSLSKLGIYPKGYGTFFDKSATDKEVDKIKPLVLKGVRARTCKDGLDICREIIEILKPFILEQYEEIRQEEEQMEQLMELLQELIDSSQFQESDESQKNDSQNGYTIHIRMPKKEQDSDGDESEENDDGEELGSGEGISIDMPGNDSQDEGEDEEDGSGKDESQDEDEDSESCTGNGSSIEESGEESEEESSKSSKGNSNDESDDETKDDKSEADSQNEEDNEKDKEKDSESDKKSKETEDVKDSKKDDDGKESEDTDSSKEDNDDSNSDSSNSDESANSDALDGNSEEDKDIDKSRNDYELSQGANPDTKEQEIEKGFDANDIQKKMDEISQDLLEEAKNDINTINKIDRDNAPIEDSDALTPKERQEIFGGRGMLFTEHPTNKMNLDFELPNDMKIAGKRFRREIEKIFKNRSALNVHQQERGDLNGEDLFKVAMKDYNVFSVMGNKSVSDYCAYILQDGSGSMRGENEAQSSYALSVVEEGLKGVIPFKITTFAASNGVEHYVVKNWNDNSKKNYSHNFLHNRSAGGYNEDGYSIRVATKELLKRPEKDRILIILSDGAPPSLDDTREAIKEARAKKIFVVGIFFGSKDYREYAMDNYMHMYQKNIISTAPKDIPAKLTMMLKKILIR